MYVLYVVIEYLYPLLTICHISLSLLAIKLSLQMDANRLMPPIVEDSTYDLVTPTCTHERSRTLVHTHARQTGTHTQTHAHIYTRIIQTLYLQKTWFFSKLCI